VYKEPGLVSTQDLVQFSETHLINSTYDLLWGKMYNYMPCKSKVIYSCINVLFKPTLMAYSFFFFRETEKRLKITIGSKEKNKQD